MDQLADNLRAHCNFLADPELDGRVPGKEGNRLAREYIRDRLAELPLYPLFNGNWHQEYLAEASGVPVNAVNIGAVLSPEAEEKDDPCLLVGAHYDHLEGIPGADDNASSVAIMIEAARIPSRSTRKPSAQGHRVCRLRCRRTALLFDQRHGQHLFLQA